MIRYREGDDIGALEPWPFEGAESAYEVLEGDPQASGRLDTGGPGHVTRGGIWRCTPGRFACTEQGDELMTILSGRCRIVDHATGEIHALEKGDTFLSRDGARVTWEISETVTKVFFAHKPGGY
jgi:uncharacterized cupin superfamily protein